MDYRRLLLAVFSKYSKPHHSRRLGRCDSVLVIGHEAAALPVHFAVPPSLEPGGFPPCSGATWIGQTARRCRQSRDGMFALDLEPATEFRCLVATLKHAAAITPLSCGLDSRCAVDARKGGKKQEPEPAQKCSLVVKGYHSVCRSGTRAYQAVVEGLAQRRCYPVPFAPAAAPAPLASSQA